MLDMLENILVPIFQAQNLLHILKKKKRLELNLWISVKNIWVLFFFFFGHPVVIKKIERKTKHLN